VLTFGKSPFASNLQLVSESIGVCCWLSYLSDLEALLYRGEFRRGEVADLLVSRPGTPDVLFPLRLSAAS